MFSKIRFTLLIVLVLAQLTTVGTLILVSSRVMNQAQSDHTDALLRTAAAESADHVRDHLAPAEALVGLSSSIASDPQISADMLITTFQDALIRTPQLSGAFIGEPNGDFTYVSRTDDGYRTKTIRNDNGQRETRLVFTDSDLNVLQDEFDANDTYDPTDRPWYQIATSDEVSWTDPYVFFTSRELGITASTQITHDGEVLGVVGTDIELGSLSAFLTTLRVGPEGRAVITDLMGNVIAHPNPNLIQMSDGDSFRTVDIAELVDTAASAAVASFDQVDPDMPAPVTEFTSETTGDSRATFVTVPVGQAAWKITVFGPAKDLIGGLTAARSRINLLTLLVGAFSVFAFGLIMVPATRSIGTLQTEATTDELTKIPNRRSILRTTDVISRSAGSYAIAMIDLDRFKVVNDTYGHQVGDYVLVEVVRRLSANVRPDMTVGRLGGEEFLVSIPDTSAHQAQAAAEVLRRAISSAPITVGGESFSVTVSIGLAVTDQPMKREQLLTTADIALRMAKERGRNQVVTRTVSGEVLDLITLGSSQVE